MKTRAKGIVCIITAGFFFALMSLFVRLSGDLPSMQKSLFRNLVALVVIGFSLVKSHEKIEIHREDWKFLTLRAIFGTIGIFCNFYAISHLVLSDANMLNKLSPFFAIVFSFLILKERPTLLQGMSVIIAFIGALFIIKPTGNMSSVSALIGFFGGAGAGAAYTMVRILGQRGVSGKVVIIYFSAFSCLASVPFIIGNYHPMTMQQLLYLIGAGVAATGGQVFITKAYYFAPARELSVYDYSQIMFSALLGFFFLGQLPDKYSVVGYIIICATAVAMYLHNQKEYKTLQS